MAPSTMRLVHAGARGCSVGALSYLQCGCECGLGWVGSTLLNTRTAYRVKIPTFSPAQRVQVSGCQLGSPIVFCRAHTPLLLHFAVLARHSWDLAMLTRYSRDLAMLTRHSYGTDMSLLSILPC
jgi:hypothetical protein